MSDEPLSAQDRDRMNAALEFVRRTGAESIGIRYQDDDAPVVWIAVAGYVDDRWETDAALSPFRAVLRLCERLADGGQCTHCGRPTGLDPDTLDTMPMSHLVCWYQFDPELKVFRRGCE